MVSFLEPKVVVEPVIRRCPVQVYDSEEGKVWLFVLCARR